MLLSHQSLTTVTVYGLPSTEIQKLQRIQNSAARLIVGTKRREHISPILYDLHWLPVRERIIFKVLLVTFKALHGLAPSYIGNLIKQSNPCRSLLSSSKGFLAVPTSNLQTYGDHVFSIATPKLRMELNPN